jgi:hypothetical protein
MTMQKTLFNIPATGKKIQAQTFQIIDDNTHKMEMFMTPAVKNLNQWSSHLPEKNKSFVFKNVFL